MNRIPVCTTNRWQLLQFVIAFFFFSFAQSIDAQNGTLVFIDDAPDDTMVDCFGDLPDSPNLRAVETVEPGVFDTIEVESIDKISNLNAPCTGGSVLRIWEREGESNTIRE